MVIMKRPTRYSSAALIASLLVAGQLQARPVNFNEVSLLVRCRESEASIRDEVVHRKLQHPLTQQQEATLRTQGATDSLLQLLRNSNLVASREDADAADALDRRKAAAVTHQEAAPRGPRVHVFNIAYGHPINLSQWGGLDYEIAINSYRVAGEDYVEPVMVDQYRTNTNVSRYVHMTSESEAFNTDWFPTNEVRNFRFTPYNRREDVRDNRFNWSDTVELSSHAVGRALRIDWDSPVFFNGQPYTFYRIYGAGGVGLYYIGKATDHAAMVAVVAAD